MSADARDTSLNVYCLLNTTLSLQATVARAFFMKGSYRIPANPKAVSLDATVVDQSARRLARPLARAADRPGTLSVNFPAVNDHAVATQPSAALELQLTVQRSRCPFLARDLDLVLDVDGCCTPIGHRRRPGHARRRRHPRAEHERGHRSLGRHPHDRRPARRRAKGGPATRRARRSSCSCALLRAPRAPSASGVDSRLVFRPYSSSSQASSGCPRTGHLPVDADRAVISANDDFARTYIVTPNSDGVIHDRGGLRRNDRDPEQQPPQDRLRLLQVFSTPASQVSVYEGYTIKIPVGLEFEFQGDNPNRMHGFAVLLNFSVRTFPDSSRLATPLRRGPAMAHG